MRVNPSFIFKKACIALLIISPVIFSSILIDLHFKKSPFDYAPYWSDEVNYWHQTLTFTQAGFGGGYYTFEERPAPVESIHFGTHGPAFPILFGLLGTIFGWKFYSATIFNFCLVILALGYFAWKIKPKPVQLLLLGLSLVTFWPLLLYLHSNMQEGVNFAFAILLAASFVSLERRGKIPCANLMSNAALIFTASLFKPWWSLLFLSSFLVLFSKNTGLNRLQRVGVASFLFALVFAIFISWSAPYPSRFILNTLEQHGSALAKAQAILIHGCEHFMEYFNQARRNGLEILEILQLIGLIGALSACAVLGFRKGRTEDRMPRFLLANLLLYLLAVTFVFEISLWGDYRAFGPILLMTLLVFIGSKRKAFLVGAVALSNLLFTGLFYRTYGELWKNNFMYDATSIEDFRKKAESGIRFSPDEKPWCNTLLSFAPPFPFYQELLGLPAGIGLSVSMENGRLALPPKSKYILLNGAIDREPFHEIKLKFIGATSVGHLYQNLSASCPL